MLIHLLLLATVPVTTPAAHPSRPVAQLQLSACSIVTKLDVEDAIGRQVNSGKEEFQPRASNCDYAAKGGMVSVTIERLTATPNLKVELAAMKKGIPESVVREAPDFPGAFYLDIPDAGTQLHIVNENNEHLMISILGFGDASQVSTAAAQIARRAMKRL